MHFGKNLIDGAWVDASEATASADLNGFSFPETTIEQVDDACRAARACFRGYSNIGGTERSRFLNSIAEEIDAIGDEITSTAMKESGLPEARLIGERGRTTGQLRMFAKLIEGADYLDVRVDEALPERTPLPRSDLRLTHRPIGPVVVFGASNFPLAFSTAGGDTASALAAGCPVIVKGHEAHAGTAELVAQAIAKAIEACAMPKAVFQLLQGSSHELGSALVRQEDITAVGFTGSLRGGRALYDQCHSRPKPIPFYGELGSINPVLCLPEALKARAASIGTGWAESLTMGAGQFCTNPGVLIAVKGSNFNALQNAAINALNNSAEQKMLTDGIQKAYEAGVASLANLASEVSHCGRSTNPRHALPAAFKVDAKSWITKPTLQHEVFGAAGIFVECANIDEMMLLAEQLEGQLTATLQMEDGDIDVARRILPIVEEKAGRILCNGFPTGVEVCSAMMHGGPYPASTDVRSTSVGTLAIARWLRPVCYQDLPAALLHKELQK